MEILIVHVGFILHMWEKHKFHLIDIGEVYNIIYSG